MLSFEDADFCPLDEFPLKWRWTDERWNRIPSDDLIEIQPLNETKALELNQHSLQFLDQSGLEKSLFKHIEKVDTSIAEELKIQQWLLNCSANLNQQIIVSWDNKLAVVVKWKVFCKYWDDFCYPVSDEVAIFPFSEEWMLFYSHNEYFVFGTSKKDIINVS
jgi:hypothetical protein